MSKFIGIVIVTLVLSVGSAYYYFKTKPEQITLTKTNYQRLPGWHEDSHQQALIAFQKSCQEILKRDPKKIFSPLTPNITNKTWQSICNVAKTTPLQNIAAKTFFEKWFSPFQVKNNFKSQGLFTGYYLPVINVSLKKTKLYNVPVYGVPEDLVKINLADFDISLKNKTLIAKLHNKKIIPYPARADIDRGAISHTTKVLAWSNNAVDLFVAQIQGSAIAKLPSGEKFLLSYASSNGRAYTAIGKTLVANNSIPKNKVSLQTIKAWLQQHPDKSAQILQQNASYVFFNKNKLADAIGSEHVPLTSQRSLAVDRTYIPLGAPIWLNTKTPLQPKFQRLMMAQDTGGAIKGVIRGDIFWGSGERAEWEAGQMQQPGSIWILLPRSAA